MNGESSITGGRTRREILGAAAGGLAAAGMAGLAGSTAKALGETAATPLISKGRTKIVILGSQGGQLISQLSGSNVRCGTSVLIDVDGVLTILDCGCGSIHRIAEAGYDLDAVRNIIITHYHQDHVADLGSMAAFAWTSGRTNTGGKRRLDVYGPTGTKAYEKGFRQSLRLSNRDQVRNLGTRPYFDRFAHWHEFHPPHKVRKVFVSDRWDIRCIRVKHGGMPSVGYRIRTPDVDVVFSGDRGKGGDRFGAFARGADVLFHEVLAEDLVVKTLRDQGQERKFIRHMIDDHCNPETVGRLASAAGVGTLVLYHLIPGNPGLPDSFWANQVSPYYDGEIVVARDLMIV